MLDNKLKTQLEIIFSKYPQVEKVLLFGSRARGDNKYNSDIDLCIFGEELSHLTLAKITFDIEDLDTCLMFDILAFNELNKEDLIKNILNEGVVIYHAKKIR
ncbi:nucleotidyltransferase family protein [Clostridium cochlearium]|uniref:Nucleotidyltransferase domain-containing protein n=1 Tax=Clostridium cochlearium TaxID=1494 RepID=A0A240A5A4_CLOCO|nr:nucleotidyltransferase domain-containing protein [Clostridium cochlearium]MBV1820688.1 nucleotidyltransferase domain-containing protein [Bacteroidales bacterium MSK.15.36]NSJ92810.1 nucleotidyltransferase domain-containing protein [Coprococcus sp. MSK.21.13]MCG4570798.1 nucleotidyltransferase domain-containing protein [Clostridium cochlearium]MCG4581178.1 nucleotidyltransferase domain-containing protein [Clostridium cochlearium]MCR1970511.1 nucleotidyltransferase domain-containing protein [